MGSTLLFTTTGDWLTATKVRFVLSSFDLSTVFRQVVCCITYTHTHTSCVTQLLCHIPTVCATIQLSMWAHQINNNNNNNDATMLQWYITTTSDNNNNKTRQLAATKLISGAFVASVLSVGSMGPGVCCCCCCCSLRKLSFSFPISWQAHHKLAN